MQYRKNPLPIDHYLDDILLKVQESSTILIKASPGSGKTTRLPWFIAKNLTGKTIVLEPRRLAAKLAAERIAFEEELKLGEEVGYHFRFDKKLTEKTKLAFYTEGTFLKKALQDEIKDVDLLILDEFHERHLETDLALAWLLSLQKTRPSLKLILMSATLDTELTNYLSSPTIIEIEAPRFPVEIEYLPNVPSVLNQNLEQKIRGALEKIPQDHDTLIFLPGMREIQKVQEYLGDKFGRVFILHSEVQKEDQEEALRPCQQRKIILSTNLAESSVTIHGIKAVIDSGIQRESHYSPWNGLKYIMDRPVTQASAIQRAGRAGRTSPGVCLRLYSQMDYDSREKFTVPEILKADLTDTYVMSTLFKRELNWITPPPADRWKKARDLFYLMGFENQPELIEKASRYPVDLRLSRILIAGEKLEKNQKKFLLNYICQEIENDPAGILKKRLSGFLDLPGNEEHWERCLLAGFIDQVARYRVKQHDFIHYSGKTIKPHHSLGVLTDGFYLILDITQRQEAIKVVSIEEEWLFEHEPFPFIEDDLISVEPQFQLISQTKLGSILIDEKSLPLIWNKLNESQKKKTLELGEKVFLKKLDIFKETENYNRYFYWLKLLGHESQEIKLSEYFDFAGEMNWNKLDEFFNYKFSNYELNEALPWKINLGGKRDLKVHYLYNQDPYVEAPIQDFYGQKLTPKINQNKIALTIRLIGPHKRPLQVTRDLENFWKKTYQEMLKEFRREYPRHHWPDDPASAKPVLLKRMLED